MQKLWKTLLKGLAAVLPVSLTFYLVYWVVVSVERVLRVVITWFIPEEFYWPGLGLIVGLVILFFIGLMVNAWAVRRLFGLGEKLLERIPLIKSVYGGLKDFMRYFSAADEKNELQKVVMVTFDDMQLVGFITGGIEGMPGVDNPQDKVAVYLPMSYQLGGYTLYLPKHRVKMIDMSVEDAMRRVLTAGLSAQKY